MELPADMTFADLPDGAKWLVDPREPGVQAGGRYVVPVEPAYIHVPEQLVPEEENDPYVLSEGEIKAINDEDALWTYIDGTGP